MVFSTVSGMIYCRRAAKNQAILNGLAMEVNLKLNKSWSLSKPLQLLRNSMREFGTFRDFDGRVGSWLLLLLRAAMIRVQKSPLHEGAGLAFEQLRNYWPGQTPISFWKANHLLAEVVAGAPK
jgi:hypothetical protein